MRHPKPRPTPRTARPATRFTAALLSGTLAFGTLPAPAALAAEADREGEGIAPPALVPTIPEDDPDFDPGGTDTPLDPEPVTLPETEVEIDVEPEPAIEPEPVGSDPAKVNAEATTEPATAPRPDTETVPPAKPGAAPPSAAVIQPATDPGTQPDTPPEHTAPVEEAAAVLVPVSRQPAKRSTDTGHQPAAAATGSANPESTASTPSPAAVSTTPGIPATQPTPATPPGSAEADRGPEPGPEARFYRVRPGDSLWLIAKALLPEGASDARIAAKTQTLWQLNQARIGTGNPDLLPTGALLKLR